MLEGTWRGEGAAQAVLDLDDGARGHHLRVGGDFRKPQADRFVGVPPSPSLQDFARLDNTNVSYWINLAAVWFAAAAAVVIAGIILLGSAVTYLYG